MPKELYVKPGMKSEVLEPGALCNWGSQWGDFDWYLGNNKASVSVCCEDLIPHDDDGA